MNTLPFNKKIEVLSLLIQGGSLREISQIADVSINAVKKLLVNVGKNCVNYHNKLMANVILQDCQVVMVHSFKNRVQDKNGSIEIQDIYGWIGIEDKKLIVSWHVGKEKPLEDNKTITLFNYSLKMAQSINYAVALQIVHHNCVAPHKTDNKVPAVAAGILRERLSIEQLIDLSL